MTANLIKDLVILGLVALLAAPPILAEVGETAEAEELAAGAAIGMARSSEQVTTPAAHLFENAELASLEARAEEPGEKVAGGALSNQQLTYVVIALAAAVLVLILI